MRGQVVRGGQADNPGDMPLQLRRFAERQACVFQRLSPREQGFAIVGQAIAALMAAEERSSIFHLRKTTLRFPLFFISFTGMILHATRGDNQAIRSPARSSPERPRTARNAPFLRIHLI